MISPVLTNFYITLIRKKVVFLASFFIVAGLVILKLFSPLAYEAEATLMIEPKKGPTSIAAMKLDPATYVSYIRTQMELMKGREVLEKVIVDLDLINRERSKPLSLYGSMRRALRNLLKGEPAQEEMMEGMIKNLRKKISIKTKVFTNLVDIAVEDKDPRLATEIANTLGTTFMDWSLAFVQRESLAVDEYLDHEMNLAKGKLRQSENRLKEYLEDSKMSGLDKGVTKKIDRYIKLEALIDEAIVEESKLLARQEKIKTILQEQKMTLASAQDISTIDSVIKGKELLIQLQLQMLSSSRDFADDSPQMKNYQAQIDQIKSTIQRDIFNVLEHDLQRWGEQYTDLLQSYIQNETDFIAIRAQKDSLSTLLENYKKEVERLPRQLMEIKRLNRGIRVDQAHYLKLTEERRKNKLFLSENRVGFIRWVASAVVPIKPMESRFLILLAGLSLALIVSLASAFLAEFLDQSVKSQFQISGNWNMPVSAVIPYEKSRGRLLGMDPHSSFCQEVSKLGIQMIQNHPVSTQAIQVCSTAGKEGKTSLSLNLAAWSASFGNPSLWISLSSVPSEWKECLGSLTQMNTSKDGLYSGLFVMMECKRINNLFLMMPQEQDRDVSWMELQGEDFNRWIQDLKKQFRFVIIDAPAIEESSFYAMAHTRVDRTLLVVAADHLCEQRIDRAFHALSGLGGKSISIVLNSIRGTPLYEAPS